MRLRNRKVETDLRRRGAEGTFLAFSNMNHVSLLRLNFQVDIKHRIFRQNLNPNITGKFRRALQGDHSYSSSPKIT